MSRVTIQTTAAKVGDMLFSSAVAGRITRFDAYPKFGEICPGHTARIARLDNGRDMTLIDGSTCEVVAA